MAGLPTEGESWHRRKLRCGCGFKPPTPSGRRRGQDRVEAWADRELRPQRPAQRRWSTGGKAAGGCFSTPLPDALAVRLSGRELRALAEPAADRVLRQVTAAGRTSQRRARDTDACSFEADMLQSSPPQAAASPRLGSSRGHFSITTLPCCSELDDSPQAADHFAEAKEEEARGDSGTFALQIAELQLEIAAMGGAEGATHAAPELPVPAAADSDAAGAAVIAALCVLSATSPRRRPEPPAPPPDALPPEPAPARTGRCRRLPAAAALPSLQSSGPAGGPPRASLSLSPQPGPSPRLSLSPRRMPSPRLSPPRRTSTPVWQSAAALDLPHSALPPAPPPVLQQRSVSPVRLCSSAAAPPAAGWEVVPMGELTGDADSV
eukprot:TRINITY_DN2842_c0_g2_i1.p1 TRINITY_DN2842_c0_g2~~TRINITY_DN2842_c0_g2_i1.p1  ORF type:complete len:392 (+),score=148.82 TRINITY_DN2842_c0_g2_i1:44-1177(+)